MKNLLARWGVTLSLMCTTLLGTVALTSMQARALPEQNVVQKLRRVPVFTITNAEGAPLVVEVADEENQASIVGVFISKQAAEAYVQRLKSQNPEVGNAVQVVPLSLAEIYQRSQKNNEDRIVFELVPVKEQVEAALSLLRQEGQEVERFLGVPLFFARGGEDGGLLTVQRGENQEVPFFFNKEDLQVLLDKLKETNPNQIPNIEIDVVNLLQVIRTLKTKDDPQLNQVVLVPSRESVKYLRSLQSSQNGNE
ncbi:MAG: hypothetical protein GDA43_02685 [Hormoscilla sp. SP5CHS1]|nr:hypothetical protein [Hormoscilla sp. SP12CHS1]MBC6452226.1 hypothetical protein [Hormoscilla sp. SP5CHS1]